MLRYQSISRRRLSPPAWLEPDLQRRPAEPLRPDRRPLDEGDAVGAEVVVEQGRVLALEALQPVEVEVGDRQAAAAVALADREGRRGDRLLDPERPAGAADQRRLAGPDLAADDDDVARRAAARRRGRRRASVSAAELLSIRSTLSRTCRAGRRAAAAAARRRPRFGGGDLLGARRRRRRRAASRSGTVARSSRSCLLHRRRAQRRRRVQERQQEDGAAAELVHLRRAAHLGDPGRVAAEQLGGEVAERADDPRLDQPHLLEQVGPAGLDLQRLRVAVAGRAGLQHVGDEDLLAREPDLFQQLVQQLPGAADEGQPLAVLFGPRRLADEHQLGVGVAGPEDRLGAGLVQGALVQAWTSL